MNARDTHWLFLFAAFGVCFAAATFATLPTGAAAEDPRDAMRRVELTLIAHGYPVEGFGDTAPVDLDLIDELAPAGCAPVMRAGWLARLAIVRRMPEHAAYAGDVARGAAATVAQDLGRLDCLGVEP